jgi:hypothetical protein
VNASPAVAYLRSPRAIRERAHALLAAGLREELTHFGVNEAALAKIARVTAQITRDRYPDLNVPPHSRFAHFMAGNVPRVQALDAELAHFDALERGRRLCELVVTSVLLDAGAGMQWSFVEADTGLSFTRSEGLAIASWVWARQGGLSSRREAFGVDAAGLMSVDTSQLAAAFQVSEDNPLVGLEGRVQLLRSLGRALEARPDVFGTPARIGGMIDWLHARADAGVITAESVLALLLDAFESIWPSRLTLHGVPLGDVWQHAAVGGEGETRGLIPFHKLSQWLCYSLLYPLQVAGLRVRDLDALTGLAEYRNGGLFVDLGALVPKQASILDEAHAVGSELIVEWRGLTVALLDRLAPLVRAELGLSEARMPLASVLEGGTWAAGREVAKDRRADGGPPLRVISDGTVF